MVLMRTAEEILIAKKRHMAQQHARYVNASPEQKQIWQAQNRKRFENPSRRIRYLVQQAAKRARLAGRNLNVKRITQFLLRDGAPTHCPCCGKAFDYTTGKGQGYHKNPLSPSIDRTDNSKGYTKANICVICTRCNVLKGTGEIFEFENIIRHMRSRGQN